ncbi:MAG: beta-lactamase family protein [Rhodoferax sp.]|nr:beta-lactamase family protein [Rhodoferax sp.]
MEGDLTLNLSDPADIGLCPLRCQRLVDRLQSEVDGGRLPGAVVLVARRGRIGLLQAVGRLDPARPGPMPVDAIFRIFSMTKPLTSVAALMLMEQGRLLLSDPVERHLPEFRNARVAVERAGQVHLEPVARPATLQDLLRHTAGLTYEFSGQGAVRQLYRDHRLGVKDTGRDSAAWVQALAALPLMDPPGTVGEYSRATDVLGRVVEVVSGQTLGDFLAGQILQPLGMVDTGFRVPPAAHHRIAEPFAADPDGADLMPMPDPRRVPDMESGGGGLVSTARDYARFLQCLLGGGALDGVRLLGPRTVAYMTADHLGAIPARDTLLEPGEGFGLGFAVRTRAGESAVPGSVGTYYWSGMGGTSFFVDPAQQLLAVMMMQGINQRSYYRQQFRSLVYAALLD